MRGSRIFLHFLNDPCGEFCWAELKNEVRRARLFPEGGELPFRQEGARLFLGRPEGAEVPYTVELEVEGKPEAVRSQTTFWIPE